MKHKLKIRLALWCYYHGLEWLAYKLSPIHLLVYHRSRLLPDNKNDGECAGGSR